MTVAEYRNELIKLTKLVDKMELDETTKNVTKSNINALTPISPIIGEDLIGKLNDMKADVISKFDFASYQAFLTENYYALESSMIFKFGRCEALFKGNDIDGKLAAINGYLENKQKAKDYLEKEGFKEEVSFENGVFKDLRVGIHDLVVNKASEALMEIDKLQKDLKNAVKNNSDDEIKTTLKEIDKRLKKLNSTNMTLERLRGKKGQIDVHQRSIKCKTKEVINSRNTTIVDNAFHSNELEVKLNNLKQAYRNQEKAEGLLEKHRAKKAVKDAEKELYGRKKNKKVDAMLEERKAIVDAAQAMNLSNDKAYDREFLKTMKELKAIDKKLIGRRATKQLYDGLKKKAGYLIGGTSLTIPNQIIALNSVGKSK